MPATGVTVVLTATIDPKNVFYTTRCDPFIRLNDYQRSLRSWLGNDAVTKLVFCENSGFDLTPIREICASYMRSKDIEILSFHGQDFDPDFGKGFGEMGILRYIAAHSEVIQSTSHILKVTGRLYVSNVRSIINGMSEDTAVDVFCNLVHNLASTDSRVFGCNPQFIENYLLPLQDSINDSQGRFFEAALARAIHGGLASGLRWSLLPATPRIHGVNATYNTKYPSSFPYWLSRECFRLLKRFVFAR
jgi:hypothetical protein